MSGEGEGENMEFRERTVYTVYVLVINHLDHF